jgi:glycine cleavage system regulatory protein
MTSSLVLAVITKDKPGVVDRLAGIVAEHQGNWEASRMVRLSGQFAGVLKISVPTTNSAALTSQLNALSDEGYTVIIERSAEELNQAGQRRVKLDLVGGDRPGIVSRISHVLANSGVNLEELHTDQDSAPLGGGQLFTVSAELVIPGDLSLRDLRRSLEDIADDLMVDIAILPLKP